ncbi:hypothetical protein [Pseudomonas sp. NPDC088444]|uniref:hypothetical protein n=1 Tax=Pseudomonas sp. NPDC088444 TaxID=3364456 RepID=UPI003850F0F4
MNKDSRLIALATFATLIIFYLICGTIPVNNGAGWDGAGYLSVIQDIGNGTFLQNDPYHVTRLPGFIPAISAALLGFRGLDLIHIQTAVNIFLMALSAGLFSESLKSLGRSVVVTRLSTATLVFSWPFVVMPVYYPILSDNTALFMSCLAIWSWATGRQKMLYFTTFASLWVMPGLFVIPFILSVYPPRGAQPTLAQQPRDKLLLLGSCVATLLIMGILTKLFTSLASTLPDEFIVQHSRILNGMTALIELKSLSIAAAFAGALIFSWALSRRIFDPASWNLISVPKLVVATILLIANLAIMYFGVNWATGFKGPPLLHFMYAQTLALPFKPIVSHFIGLNPAVLIAVAGLLFKGMSERTDKGPEIALLCFVPALFFGSESRQWVGILPIAILLLSLQTWSIPRRIWCFAAAVMAVLPALLLKSETLVASSQSMGLQSVEWQYYFSRQGPWMSVASYEITVIALAIFIIGFYFANSIGLAIIRIVNKIKKQVSSEPNRDLI